MKARYTLKQLFNSQYMLIIAALIAIVSCFFVPPNKDYLHYVDYRTIVCLFSMMCVISAMKNVYLFRYIASFILNKLGESRRIAFALVFITYFFSMFIANDMALLTFLPFTILIFQGQNKPRLVMYIIILQNIAANLGGMLTPFGNPQNLFLYSYYSIPTADFFRIMLIPFLAALALLLIGCFLVPNEKLEKEETSFPSPPKYKIVCYSIAFALSVLMVFRVLDYRIVAAVIAVMVAVLDYKALLKVDYSLLAVFVCFFIFTGNLSHLGVLDDFFASLVESNTLLFAVLSCQVISNVPTAILFSGYTPVAKYPQLLQAVNIGGLGTVIASLASLISFTAFTKEYKAYSKKYLAYFTVINIIFMAVLLLSTLLSL